MGARTSRAPGKKNEPEGAPLSAGEAAAVLGVSLSTWKDRVRSEVPAIEIGRRRLYDRKDLERWLDQHRGGFRIVARTMTRHTQPRIQNPCPRRNTPPH
jgi:excisionase family DNA binding protein